MDQKFGRNSIHKEADAVVCRGCRKTGKILWDQISRAKEPVSELIDINGPFFMRLSRKPPYPIELVCRECGDVAMTAYPSTSLHDRRQYN